MCYFLACRANSLLRGIIFSVAVLLFSLGALGAQETDVQSPPSENMRSNEDLSNENTDGPDTSMPGTDSIAPVSEDLTPVQLRALFLPEYLKDFADSVSPLPTGPQSGVPSVNCVERCFEALQLEAGSRVYIIGRSVGFISAFFAQKDMVVRVSEQEEDLLTEYRLLWEQLGLSEITQMNFADTKRDFGDTGFDGILLHAPVEEIPASLIEMVADDGVLIAPITDLHDTQLMLKLQREGENWSISTLEYQFFPGTPLILE